MCDFLLTFAMDKLEQTSIGDKVSDYCFISQIPISILDEIFFKIPIKCVIRCKAVCPDWNKLLSNPNFSQNYAKNSPFTTLLHCYNPRPALSARHMYLLEISENGDCERSYVRPKVPHRLLESMSYVGSCNGFVCMKVGINDKFIVYVTNPIWGDTIQLPVRREDVNDGHHETYQFGFSPATDKFKVMRLVVKSGGGCNIVECEIFTVGVDRWWRRLSSPLTELPYDSCCATLNGFFHWIPIDKGPDMISTFDITEENFGQISLPPSLLLDSKLKYLAVFGNQLGLVDFSDTSQISVWRMNKNLVVESWTKVVILTRWLPSGVKRHNLVPVAESQNGDILFLEGNTLISCNVEQKRCSIIKFKGVGKSKFGFILGYTPSISWHAESIVESEHHNLLRADAIMGKMRWSTANVQQY